MQEIFSNEIAKDLGLTVRSVQKYIQEGFLPGSIKFIGARKRYVVASDDYFRWKKKHFSGVNKKEMSKYSRTDKPLTASEILELKEEWIDQLRSGTLNGRIYSERTIESYDYFLVYYLSVLSKYVTKPLISKTNLKEVFTSLDSKQYATRQKIYDALMCFTSFLIEADKFTKKERQELKGLKPRRFYPAKKISLSEKQIEQLLKMISGLRGNSHYDKVLSYALIVFMSETGLRASEVCNLKLEHIDLENRIIFVVHGKNKKNRKVGITSKCLSALISYLELRAGLVGEFFFLNTHHQKLNRDTLRKRLNKLSKLVNFEVTCHSFRRAFVTNNVRKGRSLVELQLMAGHSDIKTTRDYCTTTVDEVVEGMKDW